MTITIGAELLTSIYQARSSGSGGAGVTLRKTPTAPWEKRSTAPQAPELVKAVLAGRKFIEPNKAQLDVKGASDDYRKLFGLFQGLNALNALAERAGAKGVTSTESALLQRRFAAGMAEVDAFSSTLKLDQLRLVRGEVSDKARTATGVKRDVAKYTTGVVHQGAMDAESPALTGDVRFTMSIKRTSGTVVDVPVDLADMGAQTRSFGNVINFVNAKLEAAGLGTRLEREKLPVETRTTLINGRAVTLPAGPDRWAMTIRGSSEEQVSFTASAVADAVYLAGSAGKTDAATGAVPVRSLAKFQTDVLTDGVTGPANAPPALQPAGDAYGAEGRAFIKPLGPEVAAVRATATGADGSVYMLADVTDDTNGQALHGERDVALLKYDAVGNLVFTRTLGAASEAQGYALAVSADGKVAVAGSVTGALGGSDTPLDAKGADSFVTLYDAAGEEQWTRRRGAYAADEARAVAFAADGSVFVGGRAQSGMPGAGAAGGGWDGYVQSFSASGVARSAVQFGGAGDEGVTALAVEGGQVVVAGAEGGRAVLRAFTADAAGVLTAGGVRDLGGLGGGAIAGVGFDGAGGVVLAGTTDNGALSAGAVTTAHSGGRDGFVARLSADLGVAASDRLSYFGGAGDDHITALSVGNGQVYVAGTSTGALPGSTAIGETDGFLARIDAGTGAVDWSRRFSGKDGQTAPTAIAVAAGGASVLDRLGLPKGTITYANADSIVSATSARAGDQFYVSTREGSRGTAVTIEAGDTLKTLASKINRALGFNARAEVVRDGDYDRIEIKTRSARTLVELTAGAGGKNALDSLGLEEGLLRHSTTVGTKATAVEGTRKSYGLELDRDLRIDSPGEISHSVAELSTAMVNIRKAFRELRNQLDPLPPSAPKGPVPAYLKDQIASYQAALTRLGG
jgi:hypothetical protein